MQDIVDGITKMPLLGFTIQEFCAMIPMGRSTYFKLRREGKGPPECRIRPDGDHVIILRADAESWLSNCQQSSYHFAEPTNGTETEPPRYEYTVKEFCKALPMGLATYYKLKREGKNPPECHIGSSGKRTIIRKEDAMRWLLSLRVVK